MMKATRTIRSFAFLMLCLSFIRTTAQVPGNVKEILIMHHSHLDVGYTHLQPIAMELQKDYISEAITLLDRTANYPADSKLKWTCEVTEPVVQWLKTAREDEIKRFASYLKEGRIGISALEYNTTPLAGSEGLARQLYEAADLSKRFGIKVNTADLHDATGLPWPIVDLFKDSGIEMLIMAINLHLSGTPMPRPAIYRWQGPSGREIFVMNGEHYSMFDQWTNNYTNNLDTIQAGLNRYLQNLQTVGYHYDWAYLSATCAPSAYDNSPPNFDLPEIVRRWNEEGRQPKLRFATPQDLLARIRQLPAESYPIVKGDWTDYWNFGAASSANETQISLNTAANMGTIDFLSAFGRSTPQLDACKKDIWNDINFYDEHTWGAYNPLELTNPFPTAQWNMKSFPAYEGMALSKYALAKFLQQLAGNPPSYDSIQGIMVVNLTGSSVKYYPRVPDDWHLKNKWIETWLMAGDRFERAPAAGKFYGPLELEPFSWKKIPFNRLPEADPDTEIRVGGNVIETAWYKMTFDPQTGRIVSLYDKKRNWEITDKGSSYGFFQYVHEEPDPAVDSMRSAFHVRSVENERIGLTGWKPDWKARYSTIRRAECRVEKTSYTATLIIRAEADGVKSLEQRITLRADSPVIDLSAELIKTDDVMPEAIYFTFPMNLAEGWRGYFDTGDVPTELDVEQIKGTCRDWVTVSSFASIHSQARGATLFCPDAPLVMFGGFNFGRKQPEIKRNRNPLLVAWATNNYWETNFRGSQPGRICLRYAFTGAGEYNAAYVTLRSQQVFQSPVVWQAVSCPDVVSGQFLKLQGDGVKVVYVKTAGNNQGLILRLMNLTEHEVDTKLEFPGRNISAAYHCSTTEENTKPLVLTGQKPEIRLSPRELTTIRIVFRTE